MNKYKIILLVFLPSLVMTSIFIALLVSISWRPETRRLKAALEENVAEVSNRIAYNCSSIPKQVEFVSSVLCSDPNADVAELFATSMKQIPVIDAMFFARGDSDAFHTNQWGNISPDIPASGNKRSGQAGQAFGLFRRGENTLVKLNESQVSYQAQDWYLLARYGKKARWSMPLFSTITQRTVICYTKPLFSGQQFMGVVAAFIAIDRVSGPHSSTDQVKEKYKSAKYYVIAEDGRIVLLSGDGSIPFSLYSAAAKNNHQELFPELDRIVVGTSGSFFGPSLEPTNNRFDKRNTTWYVFSSPASDSDWTVVGSFSADEVMRPAYLHLVALSSGIMIVIMLICSFVAFCLIRNNRPLIEMTQVARSVACGNLETRIDPKYCRLPGRIGTLVRTFNGMISKLNNDVIATANERSEKAVYEKEMSITRHLQQVFLPLTQHIESEEYGFTLAARLIPAQMIAGDIYDFWDVGSNKKAILVAGVAGSGVAAAMLMTAVRTLARQLSNSGYGPAEVLTQINTQLQHYSGTGIFATVFLAYYNEKNGILRYCNAGHRPPIVIRKDGSFEIFQYAENTVVGVLPRYRFLSEEIDIKPSDLLFLYTEGVTDARNAQDEPFGIIALTSLLSSLAGQPITEILDEITNAISEYCGKASLQDITTVALKRLGPGENPQDETYTVFECDFPSVYGKGDSFVNDVLDEMPKWSWSDQEVFAVNMAMIEAINNAIEHGNKQDPQKLVHVSCRISSRHIAIVVRDEGEGFDLKKIPDPRTEERMDIPSGRGILLMRSFMSNVKFEGKRNELYMEKYRNIPDDE